MKLYLLGWLKLSRSWKNENSCSGVNSLNSALLWTNLFPPLLSLPSPPPPHVSSFQYSHLLEPFGMCHNWTQTSDGAKPPLPSHWPPPYFLYKQLRAKSWKQGIKSHSPWGAGLWALAKQGSAYSFWLFNSLELYTSTGLGEGLGAVRGAWTQVGERIPKKPRGAPELLCNVLL